MTAALIEHLGEVDARRLHVEKGFSSLFAYCVEELAFSEDEACRRIEAARLARRFPAVVSLVEAGTLSLTVLGLLKPHLTESNHVELLAGVSGASVRQAKEWLAARFPQPDVRWTIRKLPDPCRAHAAPRATECVPNGMGPGFDGVRPATASPERMPESAGTDLAVVLPAATTATRATDATGPDLALVLPAATRAPDATGPDHAVALSAATTATQATDATGPDLLAAPSVPARARVEPLSSDRFLVKFTASRALRDKLELARALRSCENFFFEPSKP